MQAMMCGLPCITCDVGAITEIAQHEQTALVIEPQSVDAIAQALERLRTDPALSTRLALAARNLVNHRHSLDRMVDDMLAVFEAVALGEPALSRLRGRQERQA